MPDIRHYRWIYDILTTLYDNNTNTENTTGLVNGIVSESLIKLKLYA